MSEEELTKWGNKLKLYIQLHPDFKFGGFCGPEEKHCPHYAKNCSSLSRMRVNEITGEISISVRRGSLDGDWCFEWVRYV